ncbi:hypothetical protein PAXRUDRAFT_155117 [Paxillus rubicundulus Ve08.2h10]|uniref:Uncharacterized protein n=1 Tax=Paxillus rubicundulus Ve08.2h10 TaxID=930991 RepID=A0A0D0DCD7_9AGAM|nr:hypothetical protein PAXRUDRAFT_155117 [Paxillus rubicundulus Ve08.2h10]
MVNIILTGPSHLLTWTQQGKNTQEVIPPVEWHTTWSVAASTQQLNTTHGHPNYRFYQGKTFITVDGDNPQVNRHVIWQLDEDPVKLYIGKVVEILIPTDSCVTLHVLITQLEFQPQLHTELHTPCLKLPEPKTNGTQI